MDYSKLLQRSWHIVIQNPFLLLFGFVLALTNTSAGSNYNYTLSDEEMNQTFGGAPFSGQFDIGNGIAAAALIGFMCVAFALFIVLWIAQQLARGSLIAGVDDVEANRQASLGDAWRRGWARKWTLLGISLVLLIPVLVLIGVGVFGVFVFFGAALGAPDFLTPEWLFGTAAVGVFGLLCIIVPIALFLTLWSEFAYRAAMLEGTGVFDSFGRGWRVLFENIGPVAIIVLIRIAVGIALILPAAIGSLCCLLWPTLLILQAGVTTYFSTVWTLAWRQFTAPPEGPAADVALLT